MFHVFHFYHNLCNFNRTLDPRVWYHFLVCNTNDISKVVCVCVCVVGGHYNILFFEMIKEQHFNV